MIWDFSAIMVVLVAASGAVWAIDSAFFAHKRALRHAAGSGDGATAEVRNAGPSLPLIVEYARSFFPIFVIVLILRSFLVEPFRIPSGSMIPSLLIGDFILVNKFAYGIRLPVLNQKVYPIGDPQRGDVVVFRYPNDPSTPFIKRIIGLPGDKVSYHDRRLYINDVEIKYDTLGTFVGVKSAASQTGSRLFEEDLTGVKHKIITNPGVPTINGEYAVPAGNYFVMGDNRDNSRDSRYWGFVPDENLIGKAFMIWMNWDSGPDLSRIGTRIH